MTYFVRENYTALTKETVVHKNPSTPMQRLRIPGNRGEACQSSEIIWLHHEDVKLLLGSVRGRVHHLQEFLVFMHVGYNPIAGCVDDRSLIDKLDPPRSEV